MSNESIESKRKLLSVGNDNLDLFFHIKGMMGSFTTNVFFVVFIALFFLNLACIWNVALSITLKVMIGTSAKWLYLFYFSAVSVCITVVILRSLDIYAAIKSIHDECPKGRFSDFFNDETIVDLDKEDRFKKSDIEAQLCKRSTKARYVANKKLFSFSEFKFESLCIVAIVFFSGIVYGISTVEFSDRWVERTAVWSYDFNIYFQQPTLIVTSVAVLASMLLLRGVFKKEITPKVSLDKQ